NNLNIIDKFSEKILPLSKAIGNNNYLLSLRDGFMLAFPATMFASIMIVLQNIPTTFGFADTLPEGVMTFLNDFMGPVGNATMSISTLLVVFGIGYQLANYYEQSQLVFEAIDILSFFILVPFVHKSFNAN